jgi:hypothetical protein
MLAPGQHLSESPLDLGALSANLMVSFPVRRLKSARVLWLNRRWWLTQGWDLSDEQACEQLGAGLLETFGVTACSPQHPDRSSHLSADRYGSSHGSRWHGGSGRCGAAGALNAKGIGRTPLTAAAPEASHGDGRLSLAEAVREAISAELAGIELPHGAVPVVAILATGGGADVGEAIVVRPNVVRAAHFERSLLFGTAGTEGSDQALDAVRTCDLVRAAADGRMAFAGLQAMFEGFGEQLGAAQAHRLWQGRFLTSNIAITGALVDFGSFRSVPSWHGFFGEPSEQFGREDRYLEAAARSVAASFRKYAPDHAALTESMIATDLPRTIARGFRTAIDEALGLDHLPPRVAMPIGAILQDYFTIQQRHRVQVGDRENWRLPWLGDALRRPDHAGDVERQVLMALEGALSPLEPRLAQTVQRRLERWLLARPQIHYEYALVRWQRLARTLSTLPGRAQTIVDNAIRRTLSLAVRAWPRLPPGFDLRGQTWGPGGQVLYGVDHAGSRTALLSGAARQGRASLFGHWVGADSESPWLPMPCPADAMRRGFTAGIDGVTVAVPPALFRYKPN